MKTFYKALGYLSDLDLFYRLPIEEENAACDNCKESLGRYIGYMLAKRSHLMFCSAYCARNYHPLTQFLHKKKFDFSLQVSNHTFPWYWKPQISIAGTDFMIRWGYSNLHFRFWNEGNG